MRGRGIERILRCFSISIPSGSACWCLQSCGEQDYEGVERRALMRDASQFHQNLKLKDVISGGASTLAFHLEPKKVVLRVSMNCPGCAKRVEKHISKMEGVTSFEVDLEEKRVVVIGDITPFEVVESISKVKFAELWVSPSFDDASDP